MGGFDLSLLQGAVGVAKGVFEGRQFGNYGLTATTFRDLQGVQDLVALSDPRLAAGAYLAMGVAARHDAGTEAARYATELAGLVSSLPPGALDLVPPVLRDAAFWTRRLHEGTDPSFEGLLTAPALAPCWEEINRIWEGYQREGAPKILEAIRKIRDYLDSCPPTLTPDHFDHLPKLMKGITSTLHEVGFEMGEVLNQISSFADSEDTRQTLRRLSSFLSHDNVSMVPWFWEIVGGGRDTPNEQALMELASRMTRTLFSEELEATFVQLLSFPLEIISDLYGLHNRRPPPLGEVNPYQVATVSLCCASLRILATHLLARTALQEPGLQPPLAFSVGEPLGPTTEGFGVFGDQRATITTYPNLWLSTVYNAIKNVVFAVGDHYHREDPRPEDPEVDCGPWEARQRNRVAQAKVRLEIAVTPIWGETRLSGVHWLSLRDSAGGFPLNLIIEKAQGLIVTETASFQGWSAEEGLTRADLTARLRSLSMEQQGRLVSHLQQQLGLKDRCLVEKLYFSLLNPHLVSLLNVQEVMELAAIDRLSGRERGAWWQSSGFGLFGIQALAPTGGVGYYSYLMPDGVFSGTRTVIASQSLDGMRHSEDAVRSVLESLTL